MDVPNVEPPEPSGHGEIVLFEPYPDAMLAIEVPVGPEARYEQTEAISLAFMTALQVLPAKQRAVLILRDVLGYDAGEVAGTLDASLGSVNSLLKRARATMQRRLPMSDLEPPPAPDSPEERALVSKFVRAFEERDVDAFVALLTADVKLAMPPLPPYHGREVVGRFFAAMVALGRKYHLVPTGRANGQLAFGSYLHSPHGGRHGTGLLVLTVTGDRISEIVRFESHVFAKFGLPKTLP